MFVRIVLLVVLNVFSWQAFALSAGDKKVRLTGIALKQDAPKRLSVKQLETYFQLHAFDVYNPWEKRSDQYKGIWMHDFVHKFGQGDLKGLNIRAIDDYQISLTPQDWQNFRILIATQVNGNYIPVKSKGPMRLVFPDYNEDDKAYELNLSQWMWMINKIEFLATE